MIGNYLHGEPNNEPEMFLNDPVKLQQLKQWGCFFFPIFAKYLTHHHTVDLITGYQQKR